MIELMLQAEQALALGLTDQAEQLYGGVVEADPANAIAVVGLARVALERGDQRGALELTRRALAIDPENVTALRMEARLREVLAFRGEAIEPGPAFEPPVLSPVPSAPSAPPDAEPSAPPDAEPAAAATAHRRGFVDRLLGRGT
jgi:tetratricopeptide (TPR) repeat protein